MITRRGPLQTYVSLIDGGLRLLSLAPMPVLTRRKNTDPKLVVAIDIGTTYSAVSYCIITGQDRLQETYTFQEVCIQYLYLFFCALLTHRGRLTGGRGRSVTLF